MSRPVRLPIVRLHRFGEDRRVPMLPPKIDPEVAAKRMDLYCASHPQSPAAVRRPCLTRRGNLWVVLLGRSVQDGIVGLGLTVEAALRAFDVQYRNTLQPQAAG